MSYRVDRTDENNVPINVEMSVTKRQLGLTWVGQYYSRYGEVQSENFLRLLENFASDTQPNSNDDPGLALNNVKGQLWYHTDDTDTNLRTTLKVFNDNRHTGTDGWKRLEPIINNLEPSIHTEGELWYQPSTNTLKMSRGNRWEETTVLVAQDSNMLGGFTPDKYVRSDINDTIYGELRTNVVMPDRHNEFDLGKSNLRWETIYGNTLDVNSSHSILPEFTDSYDLGVSNRRWRNGYFSLMDSINYTNVSPLTTNQYSLGNSAKWWNNAYVRTLNVNKVSTFEPINSSVSIGTPTVRWGYTYFDVLDTNYSKNLIPLSGFQYDLGTSVRKWSNLYVDVIKQAKTERLYPRLDNTYDLGSSTNKYRDLYVNNLASDVRFEGDLSFDIIRNGKSKGIVWTGITDTHSIYVEETTNSESTRLVLENKDNVGDYTLITGYYGDIARFKSTELEVVAGVLKTKGSLKVEDTSTSKGCEMVYNEANETLDFIFY